MSSTKDDVSVDLSGVVMMCVLVISVDISTCVTVTSRRVLLALGRIWAMPTKKRSLLPLSNVVVTALCCSTSSRAKKSSTSLYPRAGVASDDEYDLGISENGPVTWSMLLSRRSLE
jgi:hypothetical protein